jgi:glycopeptide antibiotics resistance protein
LADSSIDDLTAASPSWWPRLALLLWIAVILFVVTPWYGLRDHSHWARVQWIPFISPPIRLRDVVANTFFYVPFGYFYVRAAGRGRAGWAVAAGMLLSVATEVSQVYSHGRFPSTTDVVCNSAGAYLGAKWAASRLRNRQR